MKHARTYARCAGESPTNVGVVSRLLDAFSRRDAEGMIELLDSDVLFEPAPTPARPYRTYVGHAGMAEYLEDVAAVLGANST